MDYITNRLCAEEHNRVEKHLQKCSECNNDYNRLLAADIALKQGHITEPASIYYTTILPRVRERLVSSQRSIWSYGGNIAKIILPLAVSALLVVLLIRVPSNISSESSKNETLLQSVKDLNDEDVVQAVEKEYAGTSLYLNQEVAAAGVAEHLQGDGFLKSAVSKQIDNEETADMDFEEMISDLNGKQIEQVLFGLSERNML